MQFYPKHVTSKSLKIQTLKMQFFWQSYSYHVIILNVPKQVCKKKIVLLGEKNRLKTLIFYLSRMFNTGSHSVKNAGRYFEQFVKVAHPKTSTKQVKELPASLYTSPKSKYNSYNNGNNSKKN